VADADTPFTFDGSSLVVSFSDACSAAADAPAPLALALDDASSSVARRPRPPRPAFRSTHSSSDDPSPAFEPPPPPSAARARVVVVGFVARRVVVVVVHVATRPPRLRCPTHRVVAVRRATRAATDRSVPRMREILPARFAVVVDATRVDIVVGIVVVVAVCRPKWPVRSFVPVCTVGDGCT